MRADDHESVSIRPGIAYLSYWYCPVMEFRAVRRRVVDHGRTASSRCPR